MRMLFFLMPCTFLLFANCETEQEQLPLRRAKQVDSLYAIPGWDSIYAASLVCLPYPDERFLDGTLQDSFNLETGRAHKRDFNLDDIYLYLILHMDSLNEKQLIGEDDFWGPIEWSQSFDGGIEYYHIDYVEVGSGGELRTTCRDKSWLTNLLSPIIKVEEDQYLEEQYRWNRDSTYYGPGDGFAGCHYKIRMDKDSCYYVKWSCGC